MTMNLKTVILYLCICAVCCYPSRPLNDRPNELAWQAWLLVDSQNNYNNAETDRRITPKSVFIAPNIGDNGSLPDCAEGYRSDPMGRCIKFVKVDEAAHLDFLLQRLNEMYATNPSDEIEDDDDEPKPTSGPLQVNIPLGGGFAEEPEVDPGIAIIVAPTKEDNYDDQEDQSQEEIKYNKRKQQQPQPDEDDQDDEDIAERTTTVATTTTTEAETTTITTATPPPSTVVKVAEETTTVVAPGSSSDDLQALFFLMPMNNTNHVSNNRTDTPIAPASVTTTTAVKIATETTESLPTGDTERTETIADPTTDNSTPVDGDMEPAADKIKGKLDLETTLTVEDSTDAYRLGLVRFPAASSISTVRFPNTENLDQSPSQSYQISTDRNYVSSSSALPQIKLPLVFPSTGFQMSTEQSVHNKQHLEPHHHLANPHRLTSGEIEQLFKEYMHQSPEIVPLTTDRHINRRRPVSEATYVDRGDEFAQPQPQIQIQRPQNFYPASYNHRNRDRNSEFWRPSVSWHTESAQKPLVLRFERHQAPGSASSNRLINSERALENSRFLQLQNEQQHQQQQQQQRNEDYAAVYGRTRRRGNFR